MQSNHRPYNYETSFDRLDTYLNANSALFEEVDEIPSRDKLTYSNGFYIKHCTAMFVDIRNSSSLPDKYTRPRLAKIYRSYISEMVAIINGNEDCAEVNIVGDAVYGVFSTPLKSQIDGVFSTAAQMNSLVKTLNYKLRKRDIDPIEIGIGIDYGRLLMIQAGYSGSGLNEVVWMGNAVNTASKICHFGNQTYYDAPIMASSVIHQNLNEHNQSLFSFSYSRSCYQSNAINVAMDNWFEQNCE